MKYCSYWGICTPCFASMPCWGGALQSCWRLAGEVERTKEKCPLQNWRRRETVVLSALAFNNEIVCTQGYTNTAGVCHLSVINTRKKKKKVLEKCMSRFSWRTRKKEQILHPKLCVCCHIFLSGKHMDWKGVGSAAYLPSMEGENICDVQA